MRTKSSARRGTFRRRPGTTAVSIPFSSPSPLPNHAQAGASSCLEDETLVVPDTCGDSQGKEQSSDQEAFAGAKKFVSPVVSEGRCPPDESTDDQVLDKSSCLKCGEVGEVLVCSENSCPIVIHARCLGCEPRFDESGSFYCPYCTYKRMAVKVQELRRKAMLAEKKLSSFLDLGEHEQGEKKLEGERFKASGSHICPCGGNDNKDDNNEKVDNNGMVQRSEPVNQLHENNTGSDDLSAGHERNKRKSNPVSGPTVASSRQGDSSRGLDNEVSVRTQTSEGTAGPPVVIPQTMPPPLRALLSWIKSDFPADQTNAQPHHPRNLMEATSPGMKRRRLYWRKEEEEMLKVDSLKLYATASSLRKWRQNEMRPCVAWPKEMNRDEAQEAVRSFQDTGNKNLPWRKILEYGRLVFEETRTPSNLKDKWKTMTRSRR